MLSTRGAAAVSPAEAILRGLAPDGGLYAPEQFPAFSREDVLALVPMSYQERAFAVLSRFLPDFGDEELRAAIGAAYGTGFDCEAVAPVKTVAQNTHALELWHGPTLAFKDMALQLLPRLLAESARMLGEQREIFILVATSGDTGKAALEGFLDAPGTRCCVFYPRDGVSQAQRLQMVTTGGSNTHVIAVEGNFDDAQTGVKRIFSDAAFARTMDAQGRVLSSANSINFARLAPQRRGIDQHDQPQSDGDHRIGRVKALRETDGEGEGRDERRMDGRHAARRAKFTRVRATRPHPEIGELQNLRGHRREERGHEPRMTNDLQNIDMMDNSSRKHAALLISIDRCAPYYTKFGRLGCGSSTRRRSSRRRGGQTSAGSPFCRHAAAEARQDQNSGAACAFTLICVTSSHLRS